MPKGDADVSTSPFNKFNDLFSIPMQQFITKQLCPQLRLNFARIGFCQGRAQECFKCESSPNNRLNWSAIKCTPNSHLLKHSTNSQICSAGMFSPIDLYCSTDFKNHFQVQFKTSSVLFMNQKSRTIRHR